MPMYLKILFSALFFLNLEGIEAKSILHTSEDANTTKEVKIGFNSGHKPYVIKEQNTGIVLDKIKKACAAHNLKCSFSFSSNARLVQELSLADLDCIVNVPKELLVKNKINFYESKAIVFFQNSVIYKASSNIHIDKLSDIANYRINAFQGAKQALGVSFGEIVKASKSYTESAKQDSQAMQLMTGRTDIVISDLQIFNYHWQQIQNKNLEKVNKAENLVVKKFFVEVPRSMLCLDEKWIKIFNPFF